MEYKKGTVVYGADGVRGEIYGYKKPYYLVQWSDSVYSDRIDEDYIENYIKGR